MAAKANVKLTQEFITLLRRHNTDRAIHYQEDYEDFVKRFCDTESDKYYEGDYATIFNAFRAMRNLHPHEEFDWRFGASAEEGCDNPWDVFICDWD